jgi:hypothetical protein
MSLIDTIREVPHDAVTNMLDLAAFVLVTPEIIGESRLDLLTAWIKRILGGENRTLVIVVSLLIAARILRALGVPRGFGHFLFLAAIGLLVAALLMLINRFVKTTPSRQLLLLLGASLFVCARLIGIFAALQTMQ